jgi:hypothetical protein
VGDDRCPTPSQPAELQPKVNEMHDTRKGI